LPPIPDLTGPKRDQFIALTGSDKYSLWYGWNFGRSFPAFAGKRTLVRSFEWLYCFGPAVEGTATDDAGKVAAFRAENDPIKLVAALDAASAQERHEALRRLAALRPALPAEAQARLTALVAVDPYAENRAAAYRVLGATAGWQAIAVLIPKAMPPSPPVFAGAEATVQRQDLVAMFRVLGDEGRELIAREWTAAKEPLTKRFLLYAAHSLAWQIEPILAEATTAMSKPAKEMPAWHVQVPNNTSLYRCLPAYLARLDAASDPAKAQILLKAYPKNWTLYPTLARHLKPETLMAWIEGCLLAEGCTHQQAIAAWKAIGPAAKPSMQKILATWDEQLKKLEGDGKKNPGLQGNRDTLAKALEETITTIKEK
jgi:hypothetical protein